MLLWVQHSDLCGFLVNIGKDTEDSVSCTKSKIVVIWMLCCVVWKWWFLVTYFVELVVSTLDA